MKSTLPIINIFAFIVMIIANYLSNTGLINGNTNATVSKAYENLFTPAGYAFSIWGIIYLLLLGFVIYQGLGLFSKAKDNDLAKQVGWWFVISCMANSFWLFAWLYEMLLLAAVIMIVLLVSLIQINLKTRAQIESQSTKIKLFVWLPFSMYLGWISVALIANIAVLLTQLSWNGFGLSEVFWTVLMIGIAGIVNIWVTRKLDMPVFSLVGIWALIAIAVANKNIEPIVVASAYGVASVLLIHLFWFRLNRKTV